jgi:hypothetical protein
MRKAIAALALTALVTLAATQPASAARLGKAGGFEYVKSTRTLPDAIGSARTQRRAGSPRCVAGQEPIGGGGSVGGVAATSSLASTSFHGNRQWLADAWHANQPAAKVSAYAICAPDEKVSRESAITIVGSGPSTGVEIAQCPTGHVAGGGARLIGDSWDWWLNSTFPEDGIDDVDLLTDDAWRVMAHHLPGPPASSMLVDATCKAGAAPAYVRKYDVVDATSAITVEAKCPAGKVVVGGGGRIDGSSFKGHILATVPYDGRDKNRVPEDGWRAKLYNDSGSTLYANVYAACV